MIEIDQKEVLRYLGFRRGNGPDALLMSEIEKCERELQDAVLPKSIVRRFPLEQIDEKTLRFAGITVVSHSLSKNLANCSEVYLFGATLGVGPDRLISRAQVVKMSDAVIYQAASAAMIETWCDTVNEKIRKEVSAEGLFTRPRYSPGYGDCPLEVQRDLIRVLDAPKQIGLTLTDSLLMMPSKSVTAVIGVSDVPVICHPKGCESCAKTDCEYRR
jgi:hypothetical protein